MKKQNYSLTQHTQRGAVLIVALVMLLLLTIMGISSMRSTNMQERMAGNMRDQSQAFQAAETALRKGESTVLATAIPTLQLTTGTSAWQNADQITDLPVAPKFRVTTVPGVTIREAGDDITAGATIQMAAVRVEAEGYGVTKNDDGTPGATVNVRSMYIRR